MGIDSEEAESLLDGLSVKVRGYAVCINHQTRKIKFRDPYPIWAKALVAAYLAEEGFLREG